MSTHDIKEHTTSLLSTLLNGPYALPALVGILIYMLSDMSPEHLERIKEILPLLNSYPGIALAAIIVLSFVSKIFSDPFKRLTEALQGINTSIQILEKRMDDAIHTMERRIEEATKQHDDISDEIKKLKHFYES